MSIIALAKVTQTNWSNSLCKDLCKPQHNTLSVDTTVRGCQMPLKKTTLELVFVMLKDMILDEQNLMMKSRSIMQHKREKTWSIILNEHYCECGVFKPINILAPMSSQCVPMLTSACTSMQIKYTKSKTSFKLILEIGTPLAVRKPSLKGVTLLLLRMNPKHLKRVNQSLRT